MCQNPLRFMWNCQAIYSMLPTLETYLQAHTELFSKFYISLPFESPLIIIII